MNTKVCDWCTRTSRRETRVRCTSRQAITGRLCGAERILERCGHCQVCGAFGYERVVPGPGDVPAIVADLLQLAGDLLMADGSQDTQELVSLLAKISLAHYRALPLREVPPV